jgi:Uma2 family endonuclease
MEWAAVCADPYFKDAPYKVELNHFGKVVMSPASVMHSLFQSKISNLLSQLAAGATATELPIKIGAAVKVPDVVWMSKQIYITMRGSDVATVAPEICVEVVSASDTQVEMEEKMVLYFGAGAAEVWLCGEDGHVRFFGVTGEMPGSKQVPEFPHTVSLP